MKARRFVAMALALSLLVLPNLTHGQPRSGYADASPETRAMQDDDSANPAFLWVKQGEEIWSKTCRSCHGAPATMHGVAARYPAFDARTERPITLAEKW